MSSSPGTPSLHGKKGPKECPSPWHRSHWKITASSSSSVLLHKWETQLLPENPSVGNNTPFSVTLQTCQSRSCSLTCSRISFFLYHGTP